MIALMAVAATLAAAVGVWWLLRIRPAAPRVKVIRKGGLKPLYGELRDERRGWAFVWVAADGDLKRGALRAIPASEIEEIIFR